MSEDSGRFHSNLGWGKIFRCQYCGQKLKIGEDFILETKVPARSLWYGAQIIVDLVAKYGHVYHKKCYKAKEQQGKT